MIPALLQRARALAAVAATVFAGCVGGGDTTPDASADGGRAIALELDAYSLAEVDVARVSVTASVRTEARQALATVLGTWYLRVGSARVVATFAWSPSRGSLDASMQREGDAVLVGSTPLTVDGWNDAGELRFHRDLNDGDVEWYRVRAVDGVMTGRVATQSKLAAVPAITAYRTCRVGESRIVAAPWIAAGVGYERSPASRPPLPLVSTYSVLPSPDVATPME